MKVVWAATCVTVTVRSGRVVFKMLSVLTLCRAGSTLEVTMVHKGNSVRAVGGGGGLTQLLPATPTAKVGVSA